MTTLAEIRKSKHITTANLAAQIGISQGYYSNLERGKRPFHNDLLQRTAKALGVSIHIAREAAKSHPVESHKLKSWISGIKIHGLPLIKAFQYYLESKGINIHALPDSKLKSEVKEFIESNIGFSVLAELSENRTLLHHIRETTSICSHLLEKQHTHNEQAR